jgi:PAS domain S-box-containing protein
MGNSKYRTDYHLMVLDKEGKILFANTHLSSVLHHEGRQLVNSSIFDFLNPPNYLSFRKTLEDSDNKNQKALVDLSLKNGSIHETKWEVNKLLSSPALFPSYLCVGYDTRKDELTDEGSHKNDNFFKSILDKLNIGILVQDGSGKVIHANHKAAEILDTTLPDLYEKNSFEQIWKTLNTDDQSVIFKGFPPIRTLQTRETHSNTRIVIETAGKESRSIMVHSQPLFDDSLSVPVAVVSCFFDENTEKREEMQIKTENALSQSLMDHTPALIWIVDEEDKLVFANTSFNRYFEIRGTAINKNISSIVPKAIANILQKNHELVRQKKAPYQNVHRMVHADGIEFFFLVNIYPVQSTTISAIGGEAWDITDKYKADLQLQKANEKVFHLSRLTSDAIWEWNMETGQVLRNQALQNLVGFNHADSNGLSWWFRSIHPKDRERIKNTIEDVIERKSQSWNEEYEFECADGSYKYVADQGYIIYENEKPIRMIGSLKDISEVKELEILLEKQKLKYDKKIAETVIAVQEKERTYLGHELHDNVNQVLSSAKLYLDLLKPKSKNQRKIRDKVSDFIFMAIEEIRDLSSHLVVPRLKGNGLVDSIGMVVDDINSTGLYTVKFTTRNQIYVETLSENKKIALFRIVQEQMNNIIKYSFAKNVSISLTKNAKGVQLDIHDDGIGFDINQTKKGIGLSNICARSKLFDGTVDYQTSPGHGCALTVLLPA